MLDTLENVKTYLGIAGSGDDDVLEMVLMQADAMIKGYVGYDIEKATIENEYHSTDGNKDVFVVSYPPVSSGDTFVAKFDGEEIDEESYDVVFDSGVVAFKYCPEQSVKKLSFSYTGGYQTIPSDLKMVFARVCSDLYKGRVQQGNVTSERLGDYGVTFGGNGVIDPIFPYTSILDKYKRYVF